MVETVGALILAGAEAAGAEGAAALGNTVLFAGFTVNAAVGTAALTGTYAAIGLTAAALARSSVPSPENGAQPIKQPVPPRIRGYWDCRLAGYYMLFEAGNRDSQDVMAFHHGKIDSIQHVYLHDQEVSISPDISGGGVGTVATVGASQFAGGRVQVEFALGAASQTASVLMTTDANINAIWTTDYKGNGIAWGALKCGAVADATVFSKTYPQGLPLMSVVARCSPVWDPRDGGQDESDATTWLASPNPVLQLIDYLTRVDGGMGEDRTTILPDAVLALWMAEADLCDALVLGSPRYQSAGWYTFDNKPEDVVNKILATCDGYLVEAGDGTLSLTVGVYREPSEPAITDADIFGFSINYGHADEQTVNELEVTFTDPSSAYATTQIDPVRDEASISLTGVVRSQSLDLSWVQSGAQAATLGARGLLRLNPDKTGSLVTRLTSFRYLGKRWVKLQYSVVNGLQDCVIEIQSYAINILSGRITLNFNTVDPTALAAL